MASEELLLDTHIAMWSVEDSPRLSKKARRLIAEPENILFFSAITIWEISIKRGLGKHNFNYDPDEVRRTLLRDGYQELQLTSLQALSLKALPMIHRDPFDRILIAQALSEGLTLLTSEKTVAKYPGRIKLV